jgi:hypothetical protein
MIWLATDKQLQDARVFRDDEVKKECQDLVAGRQDVAAQKWQFTARTGLGLLVSVPDIVGKRRQD